MQKSPSGGSTDAHLEGLTPWQCQPRKNQKEPQRHEKAIHPSFTFAPPPDPGETKGSKAN